MLYTDTMCTQIWCHLQPKNGYIGTDQHTDFGNRLTRKQTPSDFDSAQIWYLIEKYLIEK